MQHVSPAAPAALPAPWTRCVPQTSTPPRQPHAPAYTPLDANVRAQRGQCRSPVGRPAAFCSFSSVVRQMGQARWKVGPLLLLLALVLAALLPLAGRAAAAPLPLPVPPADSAAACCAAACTFRRGVLQSTGEKGGRCGARYGRRPQRAVGTSQILSDLSSPNTLPVGRAGREADHPHGGSGGSRLHRGLRALHIAWKRAAGRVGWFESPMRHASGAMVVPPPLCPLERAALLPPHSASQAAALLAECQRASHACRQREAIRCNRAGERRAQRRAWQTRAEAWCSVGCPAVATVQPRPGELTAA